MNRPGVPYTLDCGCVNVVNKFYLAKQNVSKCQFHQDYVKKQPTGLAYYEMLHAIEHGVPQQERYLKEMSDALGPFPDPPDGQEDPLAVEIGCGASMYCGAIKAKGYHYIGVEPDSAGAEWTKKYYGVEVHCGTFPIQDGIKGHDSAHVCDFVFSAHTLEHIPDAPAALRAMNKILRPNRPLWLLVPDDSDEKNPDHLWFFNEKNFKYTVERCGFVDVRVTAKQIVPKERFLYLTAWTPV